MGVDIDCAARPSANTPFGRYQSALFPVDNRRDSLHKHPSLFITVAGVHRQKNMNARGPGSFGKSSESESLESGEEQPGNFDHNRERHSFRRIEVEEDVVGMILVVVPAGPRIVIDAAEIGEIKEARSFATI